MLITFCGLKVKGQITGSEPKNRVNTIYFFVTVPLELPSITNRNAACVRIEQEEEQEEEEMY